MKPLYRLILAFGLISMVAACSDSSSSSGGKPKYKALATQTGSISVDLGTGNVTVSQNFADLSMAGTAVFDDPGDKVTVSLEVTSNFDSHVLYNPKLWITSASEGALDTSDAFSSSFEGTDYVYYGPEAMEAGTPVSRDIILTGVTSTSGTVTVGVSLSVSPMMISRERYRAGPSLIDSGTGLYWGTIDCTPQGYETLSPSAAAIGSNNGGCGSRNLVLDYDGRTLYSSNKTHPSISKIDMVTHDYTTLTLTPSGSPNTVGAANYLAMSSNGKTLYVLVNFGTHMTASQSSNTDSQFDDESDVTVQIVKVDLKTFSVTDRKTLFTTDDTSTLARNISLSPDQGTLAMLVDGDKDVSGIYLIKTSDLSIKDAAKMPIKLDAAQVFAKKVIFVNNGTLAVGYGGFGSNDVGFDKLADSDTISFIKLGGNYDRTDIKSRITTAGDTTRPSIGALVLGPDGMVYWSRQWSDSTIGWLKDGAAYDGSELLSIIDPKDGSETLVQVAADGYSDVGYDIANVVAFDPSGDYAYTVTSGYGGTSYGTTQAVVKIDMSTHMRVDFDGDTTNGIVGNSDAFAKVTPASNDFANGHEALMTPF